jgi:hypothetical protein
MGCGLHSLKAESQNTYSPP